MPPKLLRSNDTKGNGKDSAKQVPTASANSHSAPVAPPPPSLSTLTTATKLFTGDIKVVRKSLHITAKPRLEVGVTDGTNFVRLMAWGNPAQFYHDKLTVGDSFTIEGATVSSTLPQYLRADYLPFDLTINAGQTNLKTSTATIATPYQSVTNISGLQAHVGKRVEEMIAVAIEISDRKTVGNKTLKEVVVLDPSGKKTTLCLWENMAEMEVAQFDVLKIKNALIKEFRRFINISSAQGIEVLPPTDPHYTRYRHYAQSARNSTFITAAKRLASFPYPHFEPDQLPHITINVVVDSVITMTRISANTYKSCPKCNAKVLNFGDFFTCPNNSCVSPVTPITRLVCDVHCLENSLKFRMFEDAILDIVDSKIFDAIKCGEGEVSLDEYLDKLLSGKVVKVLVKKSTSTFQEMANFDIVDVAFADKKSARH